MIVGFCGPKRSGKNYVAESLEADMNMSYMTLDNLNQKGFRSASFADPLRAFVVDIFNMDERHTEGYLKEQPVRSLMPTHEHVKAACFHHFGNLEPARLIGLWLTVNQEHSGIINKSYRELMIKIGTDIIRNRVEFDFWLNQMASRYEEMKGNLIITDVRMENEAEFVRENGVLVHISNPEVEFDFAHETEQGVISRDGDILYNNDPKLGYTKHQEGVHKLKKLIQEKYL